jgi:hypothetical protein
VGLVGFVNSSSSLPDLGGIGGYRDAAGEVTIGQFPTLRVLNALFVRDWTILFFPVNWSTLPGGILSTFLFVAPVALAACVWSTRVPRRVFLGCVTLTAAAALPVQQLLLIGTDLGNTRVVYLLLVGWAILWGAIFTAIVSIRWRALAMAWMLVWHVLMLRHNLAFWLRVPVEAREICTMFARTVSENEGQAVVGGLPQKKNGVLFLANGFPQCVAMNSDLPSSRVSVYGSANFIWNDAMGRIEPVTPRK